MATKAALPYDDEHPVFGVLILGDCGVGKTSLLYQFVENRFPEDTIRLIIDSLRATVDVGGELVELELWDTCGAERFRDSDLCFTGPRRHADGALIVYDVTDTDSLIGCADWMEELNYYCGLEHICCILVGNKCDLASECPRVIEDAKEFARTYDLLHMETSAKDGTNVEAVFRQLALNMYQRKHQLGAISSLQTCKSFMEQRRCLNARFACVLFIGTPRIGKSSLKRRMVDDPFAIMPDLPSSSTGVAEEPLKVIISAPAQSSILASRSKWSQLGLNEEACRLVQAVLNAAENRGKEPQNEDGGLLQQLSSFVKSLFTLESPPTTTHLPTPSKSTSTSTAAGKNKAEITSGTDQAPTLRQQPEHIILEALQSVEFTELLEDTTTIHVIDTGGQPEFQEILSAFISGPAIHLLMFKLNEGLQERYVVEYVSPDGDTSDPYVTSFTVEEVLFQSLSNISCYGTSNSGESSQVSATMLVGTHRDKVSEEAVQAVNAALIEKIESTDCFEKNMIHYPAPNQLLLAVDNTQGNHHEDVVSVRRNIESIIRDRFPPVKIPGPWLLLDLTLRKSGVRLLTFAQCMQVARACGIASERELKEALHFLHHKVGVIRYYPEVRELRDLVICDLQVLFDSGTTLIVKTFSFEKVGRATEQRFKKTGRFTVEQVKELSFAKNLLPPEKLVRLLQHLYILAAIRRGFFGQVKEYFMPCVLQPFPVETISQPENARGPAPLLLSFECGYCPVGIFSALVVHLLTSGSTRRIVWELSEGDLYRNLITFYVGPDLDKVVLIFRPRFYEVHMERQVTREQKLTLQEVCKGIYSALQKGLTKVMKSRNYTRRTAHRMGFYCTRGKCKDSHPAFCSKESQHVMRCRETGEPMSLLPKHAIWFGRVDDQKVCEVEEDFVVIGANLESVTVPASVTTVTIPDVQPQVDDTAAEDELPVNEVDESPLGMESLFEVKHQLLSVKRWFDLGLALGLLHPTLEEIKLRNREDTGQCLTDMLAAWLQRKDRVLHKGEPSWQSLTRALIHPVVGYKNIARVIVEDHGIPIPSFLL